MTKTKRDRPVKAPLGAGVCGHWECGITECMLATTATPSTPKGPLHKPLISSPLVGSPDSSLHCSPVSTVSKPRWSNASTMSSRSSCTSRRSRFSIAGRFSLGGMMDSKAFDALEEDTIEHGDDPTIGSAVTSNSAEYKVMVHSVPMVDSKEQEGTYTGALDKRTMKPHGQGTMAYKDSIYEGQWVNGDWCGFGHLTDTNSGDVYEGGFFDNMKHGSGVMKYADGRVYDGMFMLDKIEQKGRLVETDGTKYWGHWSKDGVPHGRGKMEFPDGRVYDGEFDQGVLSGHGRMTFPDGTWYLGEWSDGLPNGLGMNVDGSGGLVFEGLYAKGEPFEGSSMRHEPKCFGPYLLYRSSVAKTGGGTLVGPLPQQVYMRPRMDWALKNL
eukprot:Nitzschia sp. Nitz4//scaffold36_size144017//107978//109126//NITZ4_003109-RA/size144017-processed-gene-0.275-mRNA-1//-1//CDS//3329549525//8417//frame0